MSNPMNLAEYIKVIAVAFLKWITKEQIIRGFENIGNQDCHEKWFYTDKYYTEEELYDYWLDKIYFKVNKTEEDEY